MFEGCGDEHGDRRVKEGNAPTDFAREGVEVRGWGPAFPARVSAVFAGAEAWDWVTEAQCGDTPKFGVGEVKGQMFGWGAVNGPIPHAPCGKEACLLVLGKVEPNGLGL